MTMTPRLALFRPARLAPALAASLALLTAACTPGTPAPPATPPAPSMRPAAPPAPGGAATLSVFKHDGALQCQGEGESPQAMQARELAGVAVLAARRDRLPGVEFPAVCGGMTGNVNVFVIRAADWPRARVRGFGRWPPGGQALPPSRDQDAPPPAPQTPALPAPPGTARAP